MPNNPLKNALLASGYIILVATFIESAQYLLADTPDTIFAPIAMLSLLVFSVSVMAAIFFLKPVQMYLDGQKKEAVSLFLYTVAYFGGLTLIAVILLAAAPFVSTL